MIEKYAAEQKDMTISSTQTLIGQQPTSPNTEESFTVNIPNPKGGYTSVTIKKSGDGTLRLPQWSYQEIAVLCPHQGYRVSLYPYP